MSLEQLREKFLKDIQVVVDSESLKKVQSQYLGRKGIIPDLYSALPQIPPEERKQRGAQINAFRDLVSRTVQDQEQKISEKECLTQPGQPRLDLTLPLPEPEFRGRHPISMTMEYLIDILCDMGFDVGEGTEVEHEDFNFTYLNIPENHPARAMQDTFYVRRPHLLRTHTSPVQIHYMRAYPDLPIQMIAPGRVYRSDDDATHSPMFHQIEGLWVDEGVHFGHLKGVTTAFLQKVFDSDRVRFRPSYFPFTEPSTEVDIGCVFCSTPTATSCRVCKGTRWLEVMGAGVVHPQVLEYGGCFKKHRSKQISGFAFGLGIERLAMLLCRIPDMRMLFDNDPRILNQVSRTRVFPRSGV